MSLLAAQAFSTCICIDKYKKQSPRRVGVDALLSLSSY